MFSYMFLRRYIDDKTNDLIIARMMLSFALSIFDVAPALFLRYLGASDSFIGFILAGVIFISLAVSIVSTIPLEKINQYKLFLLSTIVPGLFLCLLIFFPNIYVFIAFMIVFSIFSSLRKNAFSIIFKDITKNKDFTQKESLMYSTTNIGWFLGPVIGGLVLDNYGFSALFMVSAIFYLITFIISLLTNLKLKSKKRIDIDHNFIQNIFNYFRKKQLIKPYVIASVSTIWYAMIFVYIPILIVESNLSTVWVGIFIAATQLPLIFVEFKLNTICRKFGARNILFFAFLYLTLITFVLFFYSNIYLVMILLSTAAFALGFIEPLREIYFFKNVKMIDEEKTYPIFSTSFSVGGLIGKASLGAILLFFPFNYIFIGMSFIMFLSTIFTLSLRNFKS